MRVIIAGRYVREMGYERHMSTTRRSAAAHERETARGTSGDVI